MGNLIRITLFKISEAANREKLLEEYKKLLAANSKDGKPYLLSLQAGPVYEDPRSKGYTFVSRFEFASKEDMDYYDSGCPAHQALKDNIKHFMTEPPLNVYYEPTLLFSL